MDKLILWVRLEAVIEPHYPKAGNGRRPYPLSTMLRIHCMQQWYNPNDPAMEDALFALANVVLCGSDVESTASIRLYCLKRGLQSVKRGGCAHFMPPPRHRENAVLMDLRGLIYTYPNALK
jgi:hypothetical protein